MEVVWRGEEGYKIGCQGGRKERKGSMRDEYIILR